MHLRLHDFQRLDGPGSPGAQPQDGRRAERGRQGLRRLERTGSMHRDGRRDRSIRTPSRDGSASRARSGLEGARPRPTSRGSTSLPTSARTAAFSPARSGARERSAADRPSSRAAGFRPTALSSWRSNISASCATGPSLRSGRARQPPIASRTCRREIFPPGVRGSDRAHSMRRGHLYRASSARQAAMTSPAWTVASGSRTTTAVTAWP